MSEMVQLCKFKALRRLVDFLSRHRSEQQDVAWERLPPFWDFKRSSCSSTNTSSYLDRGVAWRV